MSHLSTVVGMGSGSGGVSALGPGHVSIRDLFEEFTLVVGGHCFGRPCSVANFLLPCFCVLRSIDATVNELKIDVSNPDELFPTLLNLKLTAVRLSKGKS
jgi:hypothetical protein